jgi:hypothetical protein
MNFYIVLQQDEPYMKPGLAEMKNAVVVPHIASASKVRFLFIYKLIIFIPKVGKKRDACMQWGMRKYD